ncbi:MAG: nitrogenase-stabilizing/protective protein NifW [Anaeromyxobacter sp.]
MMPAPIPELAQAEVAEDFFERLDVPYDAEVLAAYRVPILRRFSAAAMAVGRERGLDQGAVRRRLREALLAAHAEAAGAGGAVLPPVVPLVRLGGKGR